MCCCFRANRAKGASHTRQWVCAVSANAPAMQHSLAPAAPVAAAAGVVRGDATAAADAVPAAAVMGGRVTVAAATTAAAVGGDDATAVAVLSPPAAGANRAMGASHTRQWVCAVSANAPAMQHSLAPAAPVAAAAGVVRGDATAAAAAVPAAIMGGRVTVAATTTAAATPAATGGDGAKAAAVAPPLADAKRVSHTRQCVCAVVFANAPAMQQSLLPTGATLPTGVSEVAARDRNLVSRRYCARISSQKRIGLVVFICTIRRSLLSRPALKKTTLLVPSLLPLAYRRIPNDLSNSFCCSGSKSFKWKKSESSSIASRFNFRSPSAQATYLEVIIMVSCE